MIALAKKNIQQKFLGFNFSEARSFILQMLGGKQGSAVPGGKQGSAVRGAHGRAGRSGSA